MLGVTGIERAGITSLLLHSVTLSKCVECQEVLSMTDWYSEQDDIDKRTCVNLNSH
jgi:hypothetical protein